MSQNDELSLFRNEVADVRPIRNDHVRLQTASSPTDAQLARRQAATAEQLGKASGSDAKRKKITYPAVYGLDAARQRA